MCLLIKPDQMVSVVWVGTVCEPVFRASSIPAGGPQKAGSGDPQTSSWRGFDSWTCGFHPTPQNHPLPLVYMAHVKVVLPPPRAGHFVCKKGGKQPL